jgi:hypothetical protein
MQKVVGSSPIIRSKRKPRYGGVFSLLKFPLAGKAGRPGNAGGNTAPRLRTE